MNKFIISMSTRQRVGSTLSYLCRALFLLAYALYWLSRKFQDLLQYLQKDVYSDLVLQGSRAQKVEQSIKALQKKPSTIYIALRIPHRLSERRQPYLDKLLAITDLISRTQPQQTYLFFQGGNKHKNCWEDLTEGRVRLIDKNTARKNLLRRGKLDQVKGVPLVISMGAYCSTRGLPFPCLVDAEVCFLASLENVKLQDIQKCFEQYCESKQRKGK